jgi:DNA topoisomerase-3
MVGILCEKPSAARNFAKALGGNAGVFSGEQYQIVAARGHLYGFADPSQMVSPELGAKYKSWNLSNLPWDIGEFDWKRRCKKDAAELLKQLKTALFSCSEIAIATDVDPSGEGELLAMEILIELGLTRKKLTRMYFVDESEKEIQKAFLQRKIIPDVDKDADYGKALFRAKFDFLTMQFTRIATNCGDGVSVLRQGRLKSAMVKIVGDGLKAVSNYKKIPSYQNKFRDENGNIFTSADEPSFANKSDVPAKYGRSIAVVKSTERKTAPPKKLLDLAALSATLSAKGTKAQDVLSVYQKMYEAGIVSYPRTEDKVVSPEQFAELLPLADKIAALVGVDARLLTHKKPRDSHVKAGGAHGANRPGLKVPQNLETLKTYGDCAADIYLLLAKSYLAMLAEDFEYDCQIGFVMDYPDFKTCINIPVKPGWKAVFSDSDDDKETPISKSFGKVAEPFVCECFPPKPPNPSMKWLMQQLEKYDVGTGATRTSTYAEVTSEKAKFPLLSEKKGRLSMTNFGEMSYTLLPGTKIGEIALTEELMRDMREIAAGKAQPETCLLKVAEYVKHDLRVMSENGRSVPKKSTGFGNSGEVFCKCPMCEKDVKETPKAYSCECGFVLWKTYFGKTIDKSQLKKLAAERKTDKITGFKSAKTGKMYDAKLVLKDDFSVGLSFD